MSISVELHSMYRTVTQSRLVNEFGFLNDRLACLINEYPEARLHERPGLVVWGHHTQRDPILTYRRSTPEKKNDFNIREKKFHDLFYDYHFVPHVDCHYIGIVVLKYE